MFASLHIPVSIRFASLVAGLALCAAGAASAQSTVVRVATNVGNIDLQLLDAEAPKTVANYLAYVRSNAWAGVFIHRSIPGFVVQTGGYTWPATAPSPVRIATLAPVANEFSTARSNLRGTVAMAKVSGNPDSATSEWFVNLANNITPCPPDNAGNAGLDCQNGGFTVFARVSSEGMATTDRIAALPRANGGGVIASMPLLTLPNPLTYESLRPNAVTIFASPEF